LKEIFLLYTGVSIGRKWRRESCMQNINVGYDDTGSNLVQWGGLSLVAFKTHVLSKLIAFTCVTYS